MKSTGENVALTVQKCSKYNWRHNNDIISVKISYKKDGYRQQNVRQRQKIISIIDYDVCMTFY